MNAIAMLERCRARQRDDIEISGIYSYGPDGAIPSTPDSLEPSDRGREDANRDLDVVYDSF